MENNIIHTAIALLCSRLYTNDLNRCNMENKWIPPQRFQSLLDPPTISIVVKLASPQRFQSLLDPKRPPYGKWVNAYIYIFIAIAIAALLTPIPTILIVVSLVAIKVAALLTPIPTILIVVSPLNDFNRCSDQLLSTISIVARHVDIHIMIYEWSLMQNMYIYIYTHVCIYVYAYHLSYIIHDMWHIMKVMWYIIYDISDTIDQYIYIYTYIYGYIYIYMHPRRHSTLTTIAIVALLTFPQRFQSLPRVQEIIYMHVFWKNLSSIH